MWKQRQKISGLRTLAKPKLWKINTTTCRVGTVFQTYSLNSVQIFVEDFPKDEDIQKKVM